MTCSASATESHGGQVVGGGSSSHWPGEASDWQKKCPGLEPPQGCGVELVQIGRLQLRLLWQSKAIIRKQLGRPSLAQISSPVVEPFHQPCELGSSSVMLLCVAQGPPSVAAQAVRAVLWAALTIPTQPAVVSLLVVGGGSGSYELCHSRQRHHRAGRSLSGAVRR
jgi:hypothetical protein